MSWRVNVGDVDQRDVAERLEAQQFGLGQPLLREGARPAGRAASAAVAAATWRKSRLEIIHALRGIAQKRGRSLSAGDTRRGRNATVFS